MMLTAGNTAIVLDSTSDVPEDAGAVPEHARRPALRPLRRGEPQGPRRDRPRTSTSGCPSAGRCRRRRSRRRRTSSPSTRQLVPATSGSTRSTSRRSCRGRSNRRRSQRPSSGGDRVRRDRQRTASLACAMLALAIQRRLSRGTTDEEIDGAGRPLHTGRRRDLHRRHARVPAEGRSHRARAGARGDDPERQADPRDRDGEVLPMARCGAGRRRSRSSRACSARRRATSRV